MSSFTPQNIEILTAVPSSCERDFCDMKIHRWKTL